MEAMDKAKKYMVWIGWGLSFTLVSLLLGCEHRANEVPPGKLGGWQQQTWAVHCHSSTHAGCHPCWCPHTSTCADHPLAAAGTARWRVQQGLLHVSMGATGACAQGHNSPADAIRGLPCLFHAPRFMVC